MDKEVVVNVPDWVSEEMKLWVVEGIGRKVARRIVLEGLAGGLELTQEEEKLFEEARERAWRKALERYREEGLVGGGWRRR